MIDRLGRSSAPLPSPIARSKQGEGGIPFDDWLVGGPPPAPPSAVGETPAQLPSPEGMLPARAHAEDNALEMRLAPDSRQCAVAPTIAVIPDPMQALVPTADGLQATMAASSVVLHATEEGGFAVRGGQPRSAIAPPTAPPMAWLDPAPAGVARKDGLHGALSAHGLTLSRIGTRDVAATRTQDDRGTAVAPKSPAISPAPVSGHGAQAVVVHAPIAASLDSETLERSPIPVLIELHARHQGGAVEIIAVPWHLAANNQLSQMQPDAVAASGGSIAPAITPVVTRSSSANPFSVMATQEPKLLWATAKTNRTLTSMHMPRISTDVVETDEASRDRLSNAASTVAPWAKQLIRWLEQQGHAPALWIRDYALDASAAQQMADSLRTLSQQQGIRLERIVVNAREIWRAPIHATSQEVI
jgi:hypothetical protein